MADRMTRGSREYLETLGELGKPQERRGFRDVKSKEPAYKSEAWYERRERESAESFREADRARK